MSPDERELLGEQVHKLPDYRAQRGDSPRPEADDGKQDLRMRCVPAGRYDCDECQQTVSISWHLLLVESDRGHLLV